MAVYIDAQSRVHNSSAQGGMECPHCRAFAHMSLLASPRFSVLSQQPPDEVGFVYRCDSCAAPVFLKYRVLDSNAQRILLNDTPQEIQKPAEKFEFSYLPESVSGVFQEALGCFSHGLYQAFADMCRKTIAASVEELGEGSRLKLFDELEAIRRATDLDDLVFEQIRRILFEDSQTGSGGIDRSTAAILVEIMKDLMYQTYVRHARLRKALAMRGFFASQSLQNTDRKKA